MAVEQDWAAYADQAFLAATDTLLARTAAGAGVEVPGAALVRINGAGNADIPNGGSLFLSGAATGDQLIRLGAGRSGNGFAYIDLQGDTTYSNGLRLLRGNTGPNAVSSIEHRGTGQLQFVTQEAAPILFFTSAAERGRITPGGDFLFGMTTPAARVNFSASGTNTLYCEALGSVSNAVFNKNSTAGGFFVFQFNGTGVGSITTSGTATAYNTSSDYRLKEDPRPVENALARLLSVPVWNFAWRATGARTDGFYAHELAEVVPCAVTGDKDEMQMVDVVVEPERVTEVLDAHGAPVVIPAVIEQREVPKYQGIDQAKLVPLLVAAVQELAARVAELEADR